MLNHRAATGGRHMSSEQQAILAWVNNGTGSAVIEAVAGSGKTTVLLQCIEQLQHSVAVATRVLLVTFNRANREDAEQRLSTVETGRHHPVSRTGRVNVDIRTFNSIGFELCRQNGARVSMEPNKTRRFFREQMERRIQSVRSSVRSQERNMWMCAWPFVEHCIQRARCAGIVPVGHPQCSSTWYCHGVSGLTRAFVYAALHGHTHLLPEAMALGMTDEDSPVCESIHTMVGDMIAGMLLDRTNIDFPDQVYQPVVHRMHAVAPYDWIFVDEAQDVSGVQHALLQLLSRTDGTTRVCAAGDPFQSLYAFRGADADAMTRLQQMFSAVKLPLHTSFRCPEPVVDLARHLVPIIRAHDVSRPGFLRRTHWSVSHLIHQLQPRDLVISPHNIDLMTIVLSQQQQPVGSRPSMHWVAPTFFTNWIQTLERIFRDVKLDDANSMMSAVTSFPGTTDIQGIKATSALGRLLRNMPLQRFADTITGDDDDESCSGGTEAASMARLLVRISPDPRTVSAWESIRCLYESLARNTRDGVVDHNAITLATIHVAKGMEADRVFVVNIDRLDCKKWDDTKRGFDKVTSKNAVYVAITRSARWLTFVSICDSSDNSHVPVDFCECKGRRCTIPFIDEAVWPRLSNRMA